MISLPVIFPYTKYNDQTVTSSEPNDIYKIIIPNTSNLNLLLTDLQGGDADLQLYRDSNGNGILDIATDQLLGSSYQSETSDDFINRRVSSGTYFAPVYRFSGSSVQYDLHVSVTSPGVPPKLLAKEQDLGNLSADITNSGSISNQNIVDTYFFSLDSFEGVNINLSGLTANANLRLIRDLDNDRVVDTGETIASSTNSGSVSESINSWEEAGSYFLQIYQSSGSTPYTLNLDHFTSSIP
jgi:hypothetical protein